MPADSRICSVLALEDTTAVLSPARRASSTKRTDPS